MELVVKHSGERYLVPCSDIQRKNIPDQLEKNQINFKNATLYNTVCSDPLILKMSNTMFWFFIVRQEYNL